MGRANRIVYVDCETTGLGDIPGVNHEPFEIALIDTDADGAVASYTEIWLVPDLTQASPTALCLNRYYNRIVHGMRSNGHDKETAALKIARITNGATLAGCSVYFDSRMLETLLRSCGMAPGWHHKLIDVTDVGAGAAGMRPPYHSTKVAEALGVEEPGDLDRHTAMGDAKFAKRIHERAMEVTSRSFVMPRLERLLLEAVYGTNYEAIDGGSKKDLAKEWVEEIMSPDSGPGLLDYRTPENNDSAEGREEKNG